MTYKGIAEWLAITLTTAVDILSGTAGNDTFVGTWSESATGVIGGTLNLGDDLNGLGGTDALRVVTANANAGGATVVTGFTAKNIEQVFVKAAGVSATTYDASTSKDAVEFWSEGSSAAVSFGTNAATAITKNAAIGLKDTTQNVTANFADTLVSGAADTGTVVLAGGVGGAASPTVILDGATNTNGFETINVVSTGSANRIAQLDSGSGVVAGVIQTVNLSGSANVRIDDIDSTALKSVDASALTDGAGANINVADSTSTALKFVGSAGADRVVLNGGTANAANTFSLNGGEGKDTIAISTGLAFTQAANAALVTTINKATGFEVLEATNAGTRAVKANDFTGINEFSFTATGTATLALTGVETADKFTIGANQTGANAVSATPSDGTSAVSITGATPGQTANLVLSATGGVKLEGGATDGTSAAAAAISFGTGVSAVTIQSAGGAANQILGGADGAAAGAIAAVAIDNGASVQSLVITGSQAITILGGAGTAGGTASLPAFSGSISVNASALEAKITIAGSNDADVIVVGTKGSDVRATTGADSITLGAGNDVVVYTNANQSLTSITDDTAILNTIDKIAGWGVGADKLDVSATTLLTGGFTAAEFVAQNVVQAAVDAVSPTSLLQAAQVASANIGVDKIGVFQYGGNTYVLGNDADAGGVFDADDLFIQISGAQSLTADNFVFV